MRACVLRACCVRAARAPVCVCATPTRPRVCLLSQVCLPSALPGAKLTMANVWVGGDLMKNGLHFDQYDNLLHQIAGSKKALIFQPGAA